MPSFENSADAFISNGSNVPTSVGDINFTVAPNFELPYSLVYWVRKLAGLQVSLIAPCSRFCGVQGKSQPQ